jgi:hypothetical protein
MAVVALPDRGADTPSSVVAGAGDAPSTTAAIEFVAGQPLGTRLDFTVPAGWTTLFARGERMVVSTRPLSESDRALALLARNDSAFSRAFPAGAVVVVPQSIVKIASYAGPSAPAGRVAESELIAAGVRLVGTGDPSVRPPPPPEGSRPGLPLGTLPVPEAGMGEVARASASGSTLVLVAGRDCAYLRWVDAQPSLPGYQPLAGACGTRPAGTTIETFGQPVLVMRGPDTTASTVTMFRAGAGVARFSARLADGRVVPASIGTDGWGLVASDGRIVAVNGTDTKGRSVPETLVG